MRKFPWIILISALAMTAGVAHSRLDAFTPVVVSPLTARALPFPGTDGRMHIVYELVFTNANAIPAVLQKVEVVDGADTSRILGSYEGQDLVSHLRTMGSSPADNATIEFSSTRLMLINLDLDPQASIPGQLLHRVKVLGGTTPAHQPMTPESLTYTVAPLKIDSRLPHIGAPLAGKGWVAVNGCCGETLTHRASSLSCNGGVYLAQRFAIDWMRLDSSGRLMNGDPSDVHSYADYGADVLAVADGTVVGVLNDLNDQKPGSLPDPRTITLENVDGNHIVLDLGDGVYAFYAHLQKGSVSVELGEHVKRGQTLAKLGNTGNTSGPHLHFHLMEGTSVLCSNGMPYVMDSFNFTGQVPYEDFSKATGVEGDYSKGLRRPSTRREQYPLDLDIIDFGPTK
ncbi:MAG: M23 family metallopeptidase [Candidatus Acidiferrum sp.]|jgi:hypothetical protein